MKWSGGIWRREGASVCVCGAMQETAVKVKLMGIWKSVVTVSNKLPAVSPTPYPVSSVTIKDNWGFRERHSKLLIVSL